jgi:ABC-type transport system involved in multi-copper enzyme maturation permease subunit
MTAGTSTAYHPAEPAGRYGFATVLHAEWTKYRTVRGWIIGMAVGALLVILLGLLASGGARSSCTAVSGNAAGTSAARSGAACGGSFAVGPGGEAVTDSFYFVRQPLAGNGSITVRVTSLTGLVPSSPRAANPGQRPGLVSWAKAGLIIKDGTSSGSPYAAMMVTADHGVRLQDDYTGDTPGLPGAVSAASPRWLRLTRSGDAVTGYDSADGLHWTRVGAVHLAGLPATVQAGLFTASPYDAMITENFGGGANGTGGPSQATAVFDHLTRSGTWPGSGWTGDYIGANQGPETGSYHQAGGQFAVTGSGDIAPVPAGPSSPGNTVTIANRLVGTFAGLIAVIVVATMFITAEYRRKMIRTTLAASPRRGRMLAAKALVIGSVTFVAGLLAATIVVLGFAQLARSRAYVFPASGLTELRIIVGTAALLAAAAVLALAAGAVLRRSAAAVAAVIVAIVIPYILAEASVLPVSAADWLLRITPAAAFAIQQSVPQYPQVTALYSPNGGYYPLAPWAGLAVLAGYAALALGLAIVLIRRRDA